MFNSPPRPKSTTKNTTNTTAIASTLHTYIHLITSKHPLNHSQWSAAPNTTTTSPQATTPSRTALTRSTAQAQPYVPIQPPKESHNPHTDSTQKDADINRVHRTAELPEAAKSSGGLHSGGGSSGPTQSGSGKGGHEPKTLGENKGLGAHKA